MFLYYRWCEFFHREPTDDDDFMDGLTYIEVESDLKDNAYKKAMASKQGNRRGRYGR